MDGQRRIARHHQYAALYLGAQLEADKQKYYLGSAKVDIDSFSFDPFRPRDLHTRNSERLLSSYELTGCSQLEPANHIPAVIDERDFAEALARVSTTPDMARSNDHTQWPTLSFPTDKKVQCLRGLHRIDAASVYLRRGLRWWIVNFYSKNLSDGLKNYLTIQTSNEQPMSPGEVYFRILQCDPDDDREVDAWWAQIQSVDERAELKRLFARTRLNAPFRTLSKMHASGRAMLAGSVGSILRLKCDEEIIRYVTHIHDSWALLVGHEESDLGRIDCRTVECLEGRVPALSKSDEEFLKSRIETGSLFKHFTPAERDRIWPRLLAFPRRVPSLRLFFKDAIYLEILANCLKSLVKPARRQSMHEAFSAAFAIEPVSTFEKSYRCLVLCAMRQVESLKPGSVMLEKSERRKAIQEDPQAWHNLAEEAHHLGFRSEKIHFFRSRDPDRTAAASFLRQRRGSDHFNYEESGFESLVDQVVATLEQARKKEKTREWPSLTTEGQGEDRSRRAGRPFSQAYSHGAKFLTYDHVYGQLATAQREPTAFFVQRDIFLSFFGSRPDVESAMTNIQPALPSDFHQPSSASSPMWCPEGSHESDQQTPTVDENNLDRRLRQLSYSTISSSHYSQPPEAQAEAELSIFPPSADETDGAIQVDLDPAESSDDYDQMIRFISLAGPRPETVEQVQLPPASDPKLETLAGSYASRGMFLYDRQMRSLPPPDFIDDAHLDQSKAIFLVPRDRDITAAEATLRGLKRSGDDLASGRPRKMYLVS